MFPRTEFVLIKRPTRHKYDPALSLLSFFRLKALCGCYWNEMEPNEQTSLWTYIKACAQYRWLHSEEIFLALSADLLNINTGFARHFNFQTAHDTPQSKSVIQLVLCGSSI